MPSASRLTFKPRSNKRRREGSVWTRLPKPRAVADACGRAVRRSVTGIVVTVAVGALGTGAWFGYRFATSSPRFAITEIRVEGEQHLTEDQILAALPVDLGDNVFGADLDRVEARLLTMPWISGARARRVLPHTLVVELEEHSAAAVVELGGLYLVDAGGHPFKRAQPEMGDGAGLPVITGIGRATFSADPAGTAQTVTQALAALAAWQMVPARPLVAEISVDAHRTLTLRTATGTAIQLGTLTEPTALAPRMAAFDAIWADLPDAERARASALHFDARTDQVTVALTPTASS